MELNKMMDAENQREISQNEIPMSQIPTGEMPKSEAPRDVIPQSEISRGEIPKSEAPKKRSLREKWKAMLQEFVSVFREYPVTLFTLLVLSILGAILVDFDGSRAVEEFLSRFAVTCAIMAAGSLFTESLFLLEGIRTKLKTTLSFWTVKGSLLAVNLGIAIFFVVALDAEWEESQELIARILVVYLVAMILKGIFFMIKKQKTSFSNYCIRAFGSICRTSVIYSLFALGIMFVMFIFNELIYDTDSLIWRLELFLAGGIYAPGLVLAISRYHEKVSKFMKVVMAYVLMPILVVAFVVIYLYIFKIVIQWELPSNEVYSILLSLFVYGLPVWTMTATFENLLWGKIAKRIPFAFFPFCILQCICLGIRIADYGVTPDRYLGVLFILFELLYLGLYLYKMGRIAEYMLPVVVLLCFFAYLCPGTNVFDSVLRSQISRIEVYNSKDLEDLSEEERLQFRSIYREIEQISTKGEAYLEQHYDEEEIRDILNYYSYSAYQYYASANRDYQKIIVEGYKELNVVYSYGNEDCKLVVNLSDGSLVEIDMLDYVEQMYAAKEHYDYASEHPMLKVDENTSLWIEFISFKEQNGEISDLTVEGFLLTK